MTEEQRKECFKIIEKYINGKMDDVDALMAIASVEPRLLAFQVCNILYYFKFPTKLFDRKEVMS